MSADWLATTPGPTSKRARGWLGAAAILVACFAVYAPAIGGGFLFDDDVHLLENSVFQEDGLRAVWLNPPADLHYWPVTWTTYWIEHQLWGFEPLGYHVVNVLIHAASALLMWALLRRLGVPYPWLVAFLFAIHPVNVQSVAWISQRKNVLALFFFLISWLAYLRFENRRGAGIFALSLAGYLLAMLSKPAAAPLPAILLLGAWWQRGSIGWRDVGRAAPFFVIAGLVSLIEIESQSLAIGAEGVRDDSFLARLAGAGWVAWFYLYKALVPLGLSFVYPRWRVDPAALASWIPLFAAVALLAVVWWKRRGWGRPVFFALAYFGLLLTPVLGFFDISYMHISYVADHYQYLALGGVVALVVGCAGSVLSDARVPRAIPISAAVLVAGVLGIASALQSAHYRDSESLWRDTLAKNPGAFVAHYSLARGLQFDGRLDEAAHHYREALRIRADARASNNLGNVLQDQRQFEAAMDAYRRAIELDPEMAEANNNLASLLQRDGSFEEALGYYRRASQIAPDSVEVSYNLALLLERLGRLDEAAAHYRRCLELAPQSQPARNGLERTLEARGTAD
jgi:tetratricopeptide (TPR) repeat protein